MPFITPGDFKNYNKFAIGAERNLSETGYSKLKNKILPNGTVIVTCIGSDMGKVTLAFGDCITNQQMNSIVVKKSYYSDYLYYYLLSIAEELKGIALGGSTMPMLSKSDFEKIEITKPSNEILKSFEKVMKPINEMSILYSKENQKLSELKDLLLSKVATINNENKKIKKSENMKILHLTDFHYTESGKSFADQQSRIDALCQCLKNEEKDIDLVFFTGDLVQSGEDIKTLNNAKINLFDRIAYEIGINHENIVMCPGNHELHLDQEMPAIKNEIDKIKDLKGLDQFISNRAQFEASLTNFRNYIDCQTKLYTEHQRQFNDIVSSLYTIHIRNIGSKNIGIVTINSAWRSSDSVKDKGQLLFPISTIKDAIHIVKDCSLKIFLLHHCLSDFKEFIESELEDLVYTNFHLLFSGHYHKQKASTHINGDEGIFCDVSPAALSLYDKHSNIGFTIVDVDIETFEVNVKIYSLNPILNSFNITNTINSEIPFNHDKKDQNDLRKTIRKRYKEALEEANSLFLTTNDIDNEQNFIDLFTKPILKIKPKSEFTGNKQDANIFSFENLLIDDKNYLIYGNDKSGKTSILWKLKLDILRSYSQYQALPIYIDCWAYHNASRKIDIISELHIALEVNKTKVSQLIDKYKLVLLLDNFDSSFEDVNNQLTRFIRENKNVKVIACIPQKISSPYELTTIFSDKDTKLFIHEISKSEVRMLAQKWQTIPEKKIELVVDKIMEICQQFNMPSNYWTVSLFLWIFDKTNDANLHNNFELIQLYIDGILERKNIALGKSLNLDYEDFKSYLGSLAYELLINYGQSNYTATFNEIVIFTDKYRNINRKVVAKVEDIVDFIRKKGILKLIDNEKYTFRLNGVFEYFLAYHMTENHDFRSKILSDDHFYLSFKNELELYSGFNKKDKDFIISIFRKTKLIFNELTCQTDYFEVDKRLLLAMGDVFNLSLTAQQLANSTKAVLSPIEQDNMNQGILQSAQTKESVSLKRYYENIETNSENLEKALFILCRVFRNTNISDTKAQDEIFDFILDAVCNMGFLILNESENENKIGRAHV